MHQRARKSKPTSTPPAAAAAPTPIAHPAPVITMIPLADVVESPLNPRKRMDQAALEQLAASIAIYGVRQPVEVRTAEFEPGKFEIVFGARRRRAAAIAGLTELPCMVRTVTDAELLDIALEENDKRSDIHALDLAASIKRLMDFDPAITIHVVEARHGHTVTYWRDLLHLLNLIPDAREAFEADVITTKHAQIIARLSPDEQARALAASFGDTLVPDAVVQLIADRDWATLAPALLSTRALQAWVSANAKANIDAPEEQARLLEQMTDEEREEAETHPFTPASLVQLSVLGGRDLSAREARDLQLLRLDDWVLIKHLRDRCDSVKRALIVHGAPLQLVDACYDNACKKHFPPQATKPEPRASSPKRKGTQKTDAELEEERVAALNAWKAEAPALLRAAGAIVGRQKMDFASVLRTWMGTLRVQALERDYGLKYSAQTAPMFFALHSVSVSTKQYFFDDLKRRLKITRTQIEAEAAKHQRATKTAKKAKATMRARVSKKRN